MPKIPRFQERQRLQASNPTGFQSTTTARLAGESIARAGKGIADLGSAIADYRQKVNSAEKAAAVKRASELQEELVNKYLAQKEADKDNSLDFNTYSAEAQRLGGLTLQRMKESYGGRHMDEIDTAIRDVNNRFSTQARQISLANLTTNLKRTMSESLANSASLARDNPDNIESTVDKFVISHTKINQTLGVNKSAIDYENKQGTKELVKSAISGYMDKGNYRNAKELLKSGRFKTLFDTDEQAKIREQIRVREKAAISEYWLQKDRKEKQSEANLKKQQRATFADLSVKLEQAVDSGDPVAISELKLEFMKAFKDDKISSAHWGKLLTRDEKGWNVVDHQAQARYAPKLYKATSVAELEKVEDQLDTDFKAGNISSKLYNTKMKEIENTKQGFRDSEFKAQYQAGTLKLKSLTESEDAINGAIARGTMSQLEAEKRMAKIIGAKAFYHTLAHETKDPVSALVMTMNKYHPEKTRNYFEGINFDINNEQDLLRAKRWAADPRNGIFGHPQKEGLFKIWYKDEEDRIKFERERSKAFEELNKIRKEEDEKKIRQRNQAAEEANNELFDLDNLMKPAGSNLVSPLLMKGDIPFTNEGRK